LCIILFYMVLCTLSTSHAFELKGLQPVQPHGDFSGFTASSLGRGTYGFGTDMERSVDTNFYRATLKAGYGVTEHMDILLTVPYLLEWENSVDGLEDIVLGVKQKFFNGSRYGPSVAYLLALALPTGSDEFTTEGAAGAGFVVSKKLGPFSGNLTMVYSVPFDDKFSEQLEIVLGLDLSASHDFDIIAELYAADGYFADRFQTLEGRLGYRIRTSDDVYTVLGAGYDFKSRDPEFRLGVSFNFILGPSHGYVR